MGVILRVGNIQMCFIKQRTLELSGPNEVNLIFASAR